MSFPESEHGKTYTSIDIEMARLVSEITSLRSEMHAAIELMQERATSEDNSLKMSIEMLRVSVLANTENIAKLTAVGSGLQEAVNRIREHQQESISALNFEVRNNQINVKNLTTTVQELVSNRNKVVGTIVLSVLVAFLSLVISSGAIG